MTGLIYYPHANQCLTQIVDNVCCSNDDKVAFIDRVKSSNGRILVSADSPIPRRKPIIIPGKNGNLSACTIQPLAGCTPDQHDVLSTLSYAIGGAGVMSLAQLMWVTKLPESIGNLNTFGGAGIGAAERASNFIIKDVANYDRILKEYEDLVNHNARGGRVPAKKAELDRAFKRMNDTLNRKGQQILHRNAFKTREALNHAGRVVRESIPVSSTAEVQQLAKFAKYAKPLGYGAIFIDGYVRANQVAHMHRNNDPEWQKQAFVQGTAFVGGIIAGVAIGVIFAPALGGIILTLAVAGTAGLIADKATQFIAGKAYDKFYR